MPKIIDISVVILTYNDENNIIHTLNSVHNKFSEIVILTLIQMIKLFKFVNNLQIRFISGILIIFHLKEILQLIQ